MKRPVRVALFVAIGSAISTVGLGLFLYGFADSNPGSSGMSVNDCFFFFFLFSCCVLCFLSSPHVSIFAFFGFLFFFHSTFF